MINPTSNKIDVLDQGYVELVDTLGSDLSIVNSARASFARRSDKLDLKDERLIGFLWRERHLSTFRHAALTFEVKAPLMVARQAYKHHVASNNTAALDGWNEASYRYLKTGFEFYIPEAEQWRGAPENIKQGSGDTLPATDGDELTSMLMDTCYDAKVKYDYAVNTLGAAPEQARLFLPAYGLYVNFWWTTSLESLFNFLDLRLASDAQAEITEYAKAALKLARPHFPVAFETAGL